MTTPSITVSDRMRECRAQGRSPPCVGTLPSFLSVLSPAAHFLSAVKKENRCLGASQVSVPLFRFHPSRFRPDACPAANLVSAPDSGLRQRTGVARPEIEEQRNPLLQTGERI